MNNLKPDEKLYKQDRCEVAIGVLFCVAVYTMLLWAGIQ